MIKEKIRDILGRDLILSLLLMLLGVLCYSKNGVRGLPQPWLEGSTLHAGEFLSSLFIMFAAVFLLDIAFTLKNKPQNTKPALKDRLDNININLDTLTEQQPIKTPQKTYTQTVRTAPVTQSERTKEILAQLNNNKKKTNTGVKSMIWILVFICFIIPAATRVISEINESIYDNSNYEDEYKESAAKVAARQALTDLKNGKSLGFDVNDLQGIDLDALLDEYFYDEFFNDDETAIAVDSWGNGRLTFIVKGEDLMLDDGSASVVGLIVEGWNEDEDTYADPEYYGDCTIHGEWVATYEET